MKIDDMPAVFAPPSPAKPAASGAGSGSFAEMMAASAAAGDEGGGGPKTDLEFIREKGFSAYAEEVEKRKMAELRERILSRMGLSEEDMDKMPAEQRAAVEDLIAREIQRRMQAASETDDDKGSPAGTPDAARAIADPAGTGGAASVMLAVMEARHAPAEDAATRPDLPGAREDVA